MRTRSYKIEAFKFALFLFTQLLGIVVLSDSAQVNFGNFGLHDIHFDATCDSLTRLQESERRVYSQNGEDGILLEVLRAIGAKSRDYVEFGVQDGRECNTRILREQLGFKGVMFDGGFENFKIGLYKEFITVRNIVNLFEKYNVSKSFDVLSVDTDMFDWWLLAELFIRGGYRPRVIIVEVNPTLNLNVGDFNPNEFAAVNSQPLVIVHPNMTTQTYWDLTRYYGANPAAFQKLGKEFGYEMVYCERCGVNCFMILASEIPETCRDYFSIPAIPYPRFGVPNVTYAGHRIDTNYRQAVRVDDDLLHKLTRNVLTVADIESKLKGPVQESPISFFGRLCQDEYPETLSLPVGFSSDTSFDVDAFSATCLKSSCKMLSDHYTRRAVDAFRKTRNISVVVEFFDLAVKLDAHNFFAARALQLVSQLGTFQDIGSFYSIGLIRGHLSHSGANTNRSLRVNLCEAFDRYACAFHFIDDSAKCSLLENEYKRILYSEIYFGSEDFSFISKLLLSEEERNSSLCSEIKSLNVLSTTVSSTCQKVKSAKNVFIFGTPGSGVDGIATYIRTMTNTPFDIDLNEEMSNLNTEALCLLEAKYIEHSGCLQFKNVHDFPLETFDEMKILAKKMFKFRNKVNSNVFLMANYSLSVSLEIWRASIDETKTVFVFVLTDPLVAAAEMSQNLNISFEKAIEHWVYYLNSALKFFDSFRGTMIMISVDNAGYPKELLLDLYKYLEAYKYTTDSKFRYDSVDFKYCVNQDSCGSPEEYASMSTQLPSWVKNCFQTLRDSANQGGKFAMKECTASLGL